MIYSNLYQALTMMPQSGYVALSMIDTFVSPNVNRMVCIPTTGRQVKIQCSRSILLLSAVLSFGAIAVAADAPKGNEGFSSSKPTVVDLGPEFPTTAGLELRLRVLTIKPGGHIGLHSHKERPSVLYFVQGSDTVTRDDGTSQTFHPGETTAETGATVHWHKNDGKDDLVFVAVDVIKKEIPK